MAPLAADISIYNSAGELVWASASPISLFQLPVGLDPIRATVMPDDGQVGAVALLGPGYVFTWSGTGQAGQPLDSGSYTVSVRTKDSFGARTTFSTALTVIRTQAGVWVSIYNSAGELLRTHHGASTGNGSLRLDKEEFAPDASGQGVEIRWGKGAGEAWIWDGNNSGGKAVASGTYTVQVVRKEEGRTTGSQTVAVSVLARPADGWLEGAYAAPNPARGVSPKIAFGAPNLPSGARFGVEVYNLAGELILREHGSPSALAWDLGTRPAAGGVYLVRLKVEGVDGREEARNLKLAIVR